MGKSKVKETIRIGVSELASLGTASSSHEYGHMTSIYIGCRWKYIPQWTGKNKINRETDQKQWA